jgi:hypothetical protein
MLLDLEQAGNEVYYSAPVFHTPEELNSCFLSGGVRSQSMWVRPSEIGPLPDVHDHHVSFESGAPWTLFSEPRYLDARRTFADVADDLVRAVRERGDVLMKRESLDVLAEKIGMIADRRREISRQQRSRTSEALLNVPALSAHRLLRIRVLGNPTFRCARASGVVEAFQPPVRRAGFAGRYGVAPSRTV